MKKAGQTGLGANKQSRIGLKPKAASVLCCFS